MGLAASATLLQALLRYKVDGGLIELLMGGLSADTEQLARTAQNATSIVGCPRWIEPLWVNPLVRCETLGKVYFAVREALLRTEQQARCQPNVTKNSETPGTLRMGSLPAQW